MKTQFVFYFWFVSWKAISLGVSLWINPVHLEIHVPFGFFKIGMVEKMYKSINHDQISWRGFGFTERYL